MKKVTLLLFAILTISCAEKVIEPPQDLIPKEKMVEILHDLAILNATRTSFGSVLEDNDIEIMDFLFLKYEIDSLQFSNSDRYYASIPLEYQSIYEEVESKIQKQRTSLEEAKKSRNDSIRKVQEAEKDTVNVKKEDPTPSSN
ncbi:DUF4296 domain-containing protein [Flagellimonas allohymeniacidonis]|uniref:DUF4296 domain-containing protein n=1 Tax=Flagellimonas allohymeniacidonis TaxID=2517819 RepID=A0A4Q8QHN1_9FLAO|nr:DUF4296 domain-containing protein [Allomuricauda hymeniacidonis]TAI47949.1 DUF4296 domain-containing protein [Allomuricauda hymeniacidonis]